MEKPIRTRIIVTIQNRTTTLVSFQPFCSKWWCNGAIKNTRRPWPYFFFVYLNQLTWMITDSVSATNTPPMMNRTISWRTMTAMVPSAPPGAGLAFLWYNAHPAQMFMGDVGALALGGALGTIAVIVRQEIVLFIMGGVFVAETLSVIIQVSWFKYTKKKYGQGRRVFLMAPLHHHYEQKGWKETKVVVRFWIVTMILVLIGISTLKLR